MASQHWRWPGLGAPLPEAPPPRFEPRMEAVRQGRRKPPGAAPIHREADASSNLTGAVQSQPTAVAALPASVASGLCMHTGCAFLCTGVSSKHCCKKCERNPGSHGPKCERKLQPCSTEGCVYAVTGLTASHCCHRCRESGSGSQNDGWGSHGPHCWRLSAAGSDGSKAAAAAAACAPGAPAAEPSQSASAMPSAAQLEANRAAIAANAARIQALYSELETDLQKAM
jgi:hypothetical protein